MAKDYCSTIYTRENDITVNNIINDLQDIQIPSISQEDINRLALPFTLQEVKLATFQLKDDKAPSPDGFPAMFFHHFWDSIGFDVSQACFPFVIEGISYGILIGPLSLLFLRCKFPTLSRISDRLVCVTLSIRSSPNV